MSVVLFLAASFAVECLQPQIWANIQFSKNFFNFSSSSCYFYEISFKVHFGQQARKGMEIYLRYNNGMITQQEYEKEIKKILDRN